VLLLLLLLLLLLKAAASPIATRFCCAVFIRFSLEKKPDDVQS
jgi:hypothetical protein